MSNRIKLWKKYREDINNNIKLQEAVENSNQKLALLNKRLLEAFPNYDQKYSIKSKVLNKNIFKEINQTSHYSTETIDEIIFEIEKISNFKDSFKSIDELDFSSHELDDIVKEIKDRNKKIQYENSKISKTGIIMGKSVVKNISNTNNKRIQVAIDGPSGSGKSTVAKLLAQKYNLNYINTGLVYRTIALNAIENNCNFKNEEEIIDSLKNKKIELFENEKVKLNNIDVTSLLRTNEVSQASSKISIHKKVRKWATDLQKEYAKQSKIIMDGRDTTFNVMPNANIKIFLETSAEERARRRSDENKKMGIEFNFPKILKEIKERDYRDVNRKNDPLHKTKDAHLVSTDNLTIEQVVENISQIIERKINNE